MNLRNIMLSEKNKTNTEGYIKYEINFIELNNKQNHIYSLKKT